MPHGLYLYPPLNETKQAISYCLSTIANLLGRKSLGGGGELNCEVVIPMQECLLNKVRAHTWGLSLGMGQGQGN